MCELCGSFANVLDAQFLQYAARSWPNGQAVIGYKGKQEAAYLCVYCKCRWEQKAPSVHYWESSQTLSIPEEVLSCMDSVCLVLTEYHVKDTKPCYLTYTKIRVSTSQRSESPGMLG